MTARSTRQWRLARRPTGEPELEDFELATVDTPEPGPGEVLVRTRFLSVDPYMRGRMRDVESYAAPWSLGEPMRGGVVGRVVTSAHEDFDAGDVVVGNLHWADHAVARGDDLRPVDPERAPVSTALGILGMPGAAAYFGVTDVAEPVPGDTVVVSAAAGAVGSAAAQLAQHAGGRVIGTAGSAEKCRWLTEAAGLDGAVNYRAESDLTAALAAASPAGVDVYFDNVGGEVTDAVWPLLRRGARVAICGQIALYNATDRPEGPRKLHRLIQTRGRVQGFLVGDYADRWDDAHRRLAAMIEAGDLRYRESIVDGLERAPEAFLGLFAGENIGKQLVRVDDGDPDPNGD